MRINISRFPSRSTTQQVQTVDLRSRRKPYPKTSQQLLLLGKLRGGGAHVDEQTTTDTVVASTVGILGGATKPLSFITLSVADWIAASKTRSWTVLFVSIIIDTIATTTMKLAREKSSTAILLLSYSLYFCSLSGLALSLKSIDVSIAYAVWAALGTAIVSVAGSVFFGEQFNLAKFLCISMIVLGVVGLELIG